MKKIIHVLNQAENAILGGTFIVMVVALFIQVVNRNVTKLPLAWPEEVAIYCMIYLVMLGTEAGLRDGTQISVTAVVDRLKGRAKLGLQIFAKLIVVVFSSYMLAAAFRLVGNQIRTGQTSPVLKLPMWVPFGAFLLAFGIIVVVQTFTLIVMCIAFVKNDVAMAESLTEVTDELTTLLESEGLEMPPADDAPPANGTQGKETSR